MSPALLTAATITNATEYLRQRWNRLPKFGIILGTGASEIAAAIDTEVRIPYSDIPNFPRSTATGHVGQWVLGTLAGQPVIAMQGRFHLYEGYSVERATLPIHVMQRMGVSVLFVSNAAGGLNPKFLSGEIMLIDSHIDLMCCPSLPVRHAMEPTAMQAATSLTAAEQNILRQRPLQRTDCYDLGLMELAMACARRENFIVHRGVYAGMLGPNYETRAEYRFLRKIGADVAGMSTVPEVVIAAQYAMRVLGFSIVANVAKPDVLAKTSGEEVIADAAVAAPHLLAMVRAVIEQEGD